MAAIGTPSVASAMICGLRLCGRSVMLQSEKGRLAAGAVRGLARLAEIAGQKVQVVFAEADGLPESRGASHQWARALTRLNLAGVLELRSRLQLILCHVQNRVVRDWYGL